MRIYSMTATFGKLEHQTLTLEPGLNIIHAPNEWGKSTWCAFLVAMLYGIETRVHSTKAALADKERYAPWSGSPMSGRIDLNWNDKDITIERRTKGRSIFGEFRAYETSTGLPVPELTASNCGQVLLGVEKAVFLRAGFLKLTDLPVTQDDALRRRLNALVTSGDESGASDALSQTLRDLKNRCRFNKSGLLPQVELQRDQLETKLSQLYGLQDQSRKIQTRQAELEKHVHALENHRTALKYAQNRSYAEKLAAAELALDKAAANVTELSSQCALLPSQEEAERKYANLKQLRDNWDAMHMEAQMLPPPPQPPLTQACFRGLSPEEALAQTREDTQSLAALSQGEKKTTPVFWILAALLLVAGIGVLIARYTVPAILLMVLGAAMGFAALAQKTAVTNHNSRLESSAALLREKYRPLPPEQWVSSAESYAQAMDTHQRAEQKYRASREDLDSRMTALKQQMQALTGGTSIQECLQNWESVSKTWASLADSRREHHRAEALVQALRSSHKEVAPPALPDELSYTEAETARLLSDATIEQRQLHLRLGQCLGQMENLGEESTLKQQLASIRNRICKLEETYAALTLAMQTLSEASNALQRRFAPRIAKRAQQLFCDLTGSRYDRLTLEEDLSISAGAQGEDTLRSSLWRSDGTIDQLYFALRLAVAEELTPNSPLILDDALVRFDDKRLLSALNILKEEADTKQILLFTCQEREAQLLRETK